MHSLVNSPVLPEVTLAPAPRDGSPSNAASGKITTDFETVLSGLQPKVKPDSPAVVLPDEADTADNGTAAIGETEDGDETGQMPPFAREAEPGSSSQGTQIKTPITSRNNSGNLPPNSVETAPGEPPLAAASVPVSSEQPSEPKHLVSRPAEVDAKSQSAESRPVSGKKPPISLAAAPVGDTLETTPNITFDPKRGAAPAPTPVLADRNVPAVQSQNAPDRRNAGNLSQVSAPQTTPRAEKAAESLPPDQLKQQGAPTTQGPKVTEGRQNRAVPDDERVPHRRLAADPVRGTSSDPKMAAQSQPARVETNPNGRAETFASIDQVRTPRPVQSHTVQEHGKALEHETPRSAGFGREIAGGDRTSLAAATTIRGGGTATEPSARPGQRGPEVFPSGPPISEKLKANGVAQAIQTSRVSPSAETKSDTLSRVPNPISVSDPKTQISAPGEPTQETQSSRLGLRSDLALGTAPERASGAGQNAPQQVFRTEQNTRDHRTEARPPLKGQPVEFRTDPSKQDGITVQKGHTNPVPQPIERREFAPDAKTQQMTAPRDRLAAGSTYVENPKLSAGQTSPDMARQRLHTSAEITETPLPKSHHSPRGATGAEIEVTQGGLLQGASGPAKGSQVPPGFPSVPQARNGSSERRETPIRDDRVDGANRTPTHPQPTSQEKVAGVSGTTAGVQSATADPLNGQDSPRQRMESSILRFETVSQPSPLFHQDATQVRADAARLPIPQVAELLARQPDRPVEIRLSPEELGRVRMSLSATESGVTVTIAAERPETLDLMRRHIDQLAQDLKKSGYEEVAFEFQGNGSQSGTEDGAAQSHGRHPSTGTSNPATETPATPEAPTRMVAARGLDLRV